MAEVHRNDVGRMVNGTHLAQLGQRHTERLNRVMPRAGGWSPKVSSKSTRS